ncbi:MAG: sulfatase [Planctomycetota bacterium]
MPRNHPNVLWLFCDQLRRHSLSCAGDPNVETPNIDRLAAEGADFANACTPCPVCTPARGAVMTGRFPGATGVRYLGDLLAPRHRTVAHAFRRAGYRTSYVGKWHLASTQNVFGHNEGADYWVHPLLRGGFEDWFGFELSNHFYTTRYCTGDSMWPPKVLEGYQTDRLTDLSLEYLSETAARLEQPWFHVLSVEAPHHGKDREGAERVRVGEREHTRHPAPPEYEAMFRPEELKLRGNVPEGCEAAARSQQAQYCAQIKNLDDNVGRVLDWLSESGLAADTLVCFFSDHGEMGGSHDRFQKVCAYDESIRVPLIMRLPGIIPPGTVVEDVVSLVDVFPTCASLCGVPTPDRVQGLHYSRAATSRGETAPREAALIQWFGNPRYHADGKPGPEYRAVRTHRHTYAVSETDGECLLFDNRADPLQAENLFDDPAAGELRAGLHALLRREVLAAGESVPDFVRRRAPGGP